MQLINEALKTKEGIRWQAFTGRRATRLSDDQGFDELSSKQEDT
jgi:hypothetical protein